MFDPYNSEHVNRLRAAREVSWRSLRPFRATRLDFIKQYLGDRYSDQTTEFKTYANLLNQMAEVSTIALVAQNPQVLVETDIVQNLPLARKLQVNLNKILNEIRFDVTMRRVVLDATLSIGVAKVALGDSPCFQQIEDLWCDPGSPFFTNISLDRCVFDMAAMGEERIRWAGDYYDVPLEALKGNDAFDQEQVKLLVPRTYSNAAPSSVRGGEITAQQLSSQIARTVESDLRDTVNLFDVWVADGELLLTFAEEMTGKPLAVRHVSECPYLFLGMQDAPDNVMPVSPAMKAINLHELYNSLLRKQARQAKRQRDIPYYEGDSEADAKRLEKAEDGRWTRVNRKDGVGTLKLGGVDQGNHGFSIALADLFDRFTDARQMSGTGPQADTLGQEEILAQRTDTLMAARHNRVVDFTNKAIKKLACLLWDDPVNTHRAFDKLDEFPGLRLEANMEPWDRQGKFEDYHFRIEPYSMTYKSPSARAQTLIQLLQNVYGPMAAQLQSQGGMIDMAELTDELSLLMDTPALKRVVKFSNPQTPQDLAQQADSGGPDFPSDHVYTRKNVSVGDQGRLGRSGAVMSMMGAAPAATEGAQ